MANRDILIVVVLIIGFILFLILWARSLDRTLYGREISQRLSKRNYAMIGFALLFALGMTFFQDQFGKGYNAFLLLTFLSLAWLDLLIAMYRQAQESENIVYEIPCSKSIPTWLIVLMVIIGMVFVIISVLTRFESNLVLFLVFVLLFGSFLLAFEKTNKVLFSVTKIYNGSDRLEWGRIIWWEWTEEKDNYRKVVLQLDGFLSSVDFRTIKVPVDRYEDVDQLFQEFTNNLKLGNVDGG